MITKQSLINRSKLGGGQEPSNKQRRTFIGGAAAALLASPLLASPLLASPLLASPLLASPLLASPQRVMAKQTDKPNDPFILLLAGVYQPVVHGPNLGLSAVNLNDGSYSVTRVYPVFGIGNEGGSPDQDKAIGNFYAQFSPAGGKQLCAYQLPGGAIAMQFNDLPLVFPMVVPDGMGGQYLEGTFELTILQATGIYQPFAGGHNHMVDRLHQLASGQFDEFCFCIISQYQFP